MKSFNFRVDSLEGEENIELFKNAFKIKEYKYKGKYILTSNGWKHDDATKITIVRW